MGFLVNNLNSQVIIFVKQFIVSKNYLQEIQPEKRMKPLLVPSKLTGSRNRSTLCNSFKLIKATFNSLLWPHKTLSIKDK